METKPRSIEWFKYVITFLITAGLFVTVFYISKVANEHRTQEVRSIQDKIAIDLLSSETQFSLLKNASCTQDGSSILAPEIGQLGERLSYMEQQQGTDNPDVVGLKKYYSLLQIKDFLLAQEFSEKCDYKPVAILYFYSNDCVDCDRQGYVLTTLREKYPELRVYSFDYNLDLSAIKTLQTMYKINGSLPALVINDKTITGYRSIEDIEKLLPELKKMKAAKEAKAKAEADAANKATLTTEGAKNSE